MLWIILGGMAGLFVFCVGQGLQDARRSRRDYEKRQRLAGLGKAGKARLGLA